MARQILYNLEARKKLQSGIDQLANTVKVTLGPCGRNVAFDRKFGAPTITKDGVTVAKQVELADPVENLGARMVMDAASKTADVAGDGTTTATVLTQAIFREGNKFVAAGANPMLLKKGIDKAVSKCLAHLEEISIPVQDKIKQIATISANGDEFIGGQIAYALDKVGQDGVITVEEGSSTEMELSIVEGLQFDRGYISPYFITDPDKNQAVLIDAYILVVDKKISSMKSLLPILEQVSRANTPLLIIAEDVEADALATLVVNKMRGVLQVCAVKAPGFGDRRKDILEDIAIVSGATFISEDKGLKIENAQIDDLGRAGKIIVSKDSTTIIRGHGNKAAIESRITEVKAQIDNLDNTYDLQKMKERLASIAGGVAIMKVGAATEIEMKEVKDRIDDALHATRAAIKEGIVAGGGVALLSCQTALKDHGLEGDEKLGVDIIYRALEEPMRIIASNAGYEGSVVVMENKAKNQGFDARNGVYCNMIDAGIIDPTKVVRSALQNAASIASLLLTTEALLVHIVEKKAEDIPMHNGTPMPQVY